MQTDLELGKSATQAIHATSHLLDAMLAQATPEMLGDLENALRGGSRVVVQVGLLPTATVSVVLIEPEGQHTKLAELQTTQVIPSSKVN